MAEIPALKRRLIQEGVDVIDVGAGDADLAPPRAAGEGLARAARDPAMSRYAFQLGLPAFGEAAAAYRHGRFGLKCDPFTELHPLLGSKEGIAHLAMALLDVGDVAVVPEPGYAVYEGGTVLAGGESYRYALTPRTAFLLELEEVPAEVIGRTRLVWLNYPNNPTASVVRRAVPRAAGRDAAGAARPGVRARDAAGHAVLVGAAPRRPLLGHVPAPRTRRGRRRDRAGERVRRGRRRVFPDRAHRGDAAARRSGGASRKGVGRCLSPGRSRAPRPA